ncbi:MAG: hypothetical protein M3Z27_03055 [Actinomycetota bacterium]|nr:hypothetical protein [Actinomycetota bacterium]
MLKVKRLSVALALSLSAIAPFALQAAPAEASHAQVALFQEDTNLLGNPEHTMATLHRLGVGMVRLTVVWDTVAPRPNSFTKPNFDAANPNAPGYAWGRYDAVVRAALTQHIALDLLITGATPYWADGPGIPADARRRHFAWKLSAKAYGDFVHAVALRYGRFVRAWELFNEPNFGEDLAPQAVNGSRDSVAPSMYRGLVDAGFTALRASAHGRDTIVIGQLAARGLSGPVTATHRDGLPGEYAQTKPLQFIRTLYCLSGSYRQLRGSAAGAVGCPTTAAGSHAFRTQHPGLFSATGFGIHPYPQGLPPTQEASGDPDYVAFSEIPRLQRTLDRAQRAYGSHRRLPIYNNEYGYVTRPPGARQFASPTRAALYLNQAEYLSWRNPRIATWMQYLLFDPVIGGPSGFFSGLESSTGRPKGPMLDAYRLPLFLPTDSARRGGRLMVWGAVRPEHFYPASPTAAIQFARRARGPFVNVGKVAIHDPGGYFVTHLAFPGSGFVRVAWRYPDGPTVVSRLANVTIR